MFVIAMLTIAGIALGSLEQSIVSRILATKAKEFITPELIHKTILGSGLHYSEPRFRHIYYDCRDETFKDLFAKEKDGQKNYFSYRTLVVSVFKKELHEGTTMQDVYMLCRDDFKSSMRAADPEIKSRLISALEQTSKLLKDVESKVYRKSLLAAFKAEGMRNYPDSYLDDILEKNLSPEETLRRINRPPTIPTSTVSLQDEDIDLVEFVLRRWNEGGEKLVRKYHKVVSLALSDLREIQVQE